MHTSGRRLKTIEFLAGARVGFIDIGAREGLPGHWAWLNTALHLVAFEPEESEAAQLAGDTRPVAVAATPGAGSLKITKAPGCSSLLSPNIKTVDQYPESDRFDVIHTQPVDLVSLDTTIGKDEPADFIKIDVQGAALSVLEGAAQTLQRTVGLEVESEFVALYTAQHLTGDIHAHLCAKGFEIVDIRGTYWRRASSKDVTGCRGQLIFCDTLFMRSPESLASFVAAQDDPVKALLRVFAICEVYHLSDYIVAYAAACNVSDERIDAWVVLAKKRPFLARLSRLPFARQLGLFFTELGNGLSSGHWATSERSIGNMPQHEKLRLLK